MIYVDQKSSVAKLTSKQSAGFALAVNLRITKSTDEKTYKQRIHPGFETQVRRHQKSKNRVSMAPQKDLFFF